MSARIPRVTIGVPVFNGEELLADVMEAIIAQSFGDFVVHISDNASTDGTQRICEAYSRRDSRITYSRSAVNRGAVWNFNELARQAKTPLFMWHAVDDLASPAYVEACVAGLDSRPEAVLAYTRAAVVDEQRASIATSGRKLPLDSCQLLQRFEACLSPMPYAENALYGVIRTSALRETRLLGMFGGSDRAFLAELSLYGPFVRIDRDLFTRRQYRPVKTATAIAEYNTGRRQRVALREWHVLAWNLQSVWRASAVSNAQRWELYKALARRLFGERRLYARELISALKDLMSPN
jgi:glycosyltransferase involved in cell wall biosynthesis